MWVDCCKAEATLNGGSAVPTDAPRPFVVGNSARRWVFGTRRKLFE